MNINLNININNDLEGKNIKKTLIFLKQKKKILEKRIGFISPGKPSPGHPT